MKNMEKYEAAINQWGNKVRWVMDASDWMKEILAQDQLEDSDQTKLQIIQRQMHHEFSELLESIDGTILQLEKSDQIINVTVRQ